MFDHLTTAEINRAISDATDRRNAVYAKMIGPDLSPLTDPLGAEWELLSAAYREQADLTTGLYAELVRREQEAAADA